MSKENGTKRIALVASKGTMDMAYPPLILASTAVSMDWEGTMKRIPQRSAVSMFSTNSRTDRPKRSSFQTTITSNFLSRASASN